MQRILAILEVSQKQAYIFSSKQLKDNAARSAEIGYVTSDAFFRKAAPSLYDGTQLVYAGGGHTILQFPDRETARQCMGQITETAMRQFPGMELFARLMDYRDELAPGDNLKELSRLLEEKKALRHSAFYGLPTGLERQSETDFRPQRTKMPDTFADSLLPPAPAGYRFPDQFEVLTGSDNFLAVIHIDGNAMSARVQKIYDTAGSDWNACCCKLRDFSKAIQQDFEAAFSETVETLLHSGIVESDLLPIRPIILAGDDVCFVTAGSIALECARIFLEHLTAKTNTEDHQPYAACAGIALVHRKYPFHQAYDLSEALCSNAKKFGAELDEQGRLSVMDWHIEFGQLKNSLSALRQDYATEDGGRMELRPVLAVIPDTVSVDEETASIRHYDWFRILCQALQKEKGNTARGKLKELRTAIQQGVVETRYHLQDKQVSGLLEHAFDARYRDEDARWEKFRRMVQQGEAAERPAFWTGPDGVRRCLYFDAVELIDHWKPLEGGVV